jgi:hypothetical protein
MPSKRVMVCIGVWMEPGGRSKKRKPLQFSRSRSFETGGSDGARNGHLSLQSQPKVEVTSHGDSHVFQRNALRRFSFVEAHRTAPPVYSQPVE